MLVDNNRELFDVVKFPKYLGKLIQYYGCSVFSFDSKRRYCFLVDEFEECIIKFPFYVKLLVRINKIFQKRG